MTITGAEHREASALMALLGCLLITLKSHFPPSLRIPEFHLVGFELVGFIWKVVLCMTFEPLIVLLVFRVIRIGKYFEKLVVTIHSTAIFRRARSLTGNAPRVFETLFHQQDAFKKNIM